MYYGIDKTVKDIIKAEIAAAGTLPYGRLTALSKQFNIPINTVNNWVDAIRHGETRQNHYHWQEVIINILGKKCVGCGSTIKLELHHIKPLIKGGENTIENLQVLCKSCHDRKPSNE